MIGSNKYGASMPLVHATGRRNIDISKVRFKAVYSNVKVPLGSQECCAILIIVQYY